MTNGHPDAARPRLVLASASPRRTEILRGLGLDFDIEPADVDESLRAGEEPEAYVERLAREKAEARRKPGSLVVSADTIVVLDGRILTKPEDPTDARRMLRAIAGRRHRVLTGLAVLCGDSGHLETTVVDSEVIMAEMTDGEIEGYVASGEPLDKAGSYAIQGLGAVFVARLEGTFSNVVGLPLPDLYRLLAKHGFELAGFSRRT